MTAHNLIVPDSLAQICRRSCTNSTRKTIASKSLGSTSPREYAQRTARLEVPGSSHAKSFTPSLRQAAVTWRVATSRRKSLKVLAVDPAQMFDFEAKAQRTLEVKAKLHIGIVGFGNFGQFIATRFVSQGHKVSCTSRTDYSTEAAQMGVTYFNSADDFCEDHPDVVILATSILSTEVVLGNLPVQRLRQSTLFVDVLSVKMFPRQLLLQRLPVQCDILCTHPMFGPESGKDSWDGLTFVYDPVRVNPSKGNRIDGVERIKIFLDIWEQEGCKMVEM
ncbi:hypothetical protein CYMTET_32697, partial [Cymbomonas tetramitiformis]